MEHIEEPVVAEGQGQVELQFVLVRLGGENVYRRRENLDYDLPTLEIARLNELVDQVAALAKNSANLERVVTTGFDSLIGLTRGDNYLLDDEDGELG